MFGLCRAVLIVALIAATPGSSAAQPIPALETSAAAGEKAIVTFLVEDSVGDVELGRLGLQRATAVPVRALAAAMVRDHTRTAQLGLAVARRLAVDDATAKPESTNQVDVSHLARYHGDRFDREYVKTLVDAHRSDISEIGDALEFTRDAGLRAALKTALTIDRAHLRMALRAQAVVGSAD